MSAPMNLKLQHVTMRRNRGGGFRYYFRRRGQPLERLPDDPTSPEFMEAYKRLKEWMPQSAKSEEGTFAWLCDRYMDTSDFRSKAKATQTARRRIILTMTAEPLVRGKSGTFGEEKAKLFTSRYIEILRDRKETNPNAGNERLKVLSQIFKHALTQKLVDANPVRDVRRLTIPRGGHQTATDEEIAAYFAKHQEGPAHLAMTILTETGVRISDLRLLGRQHLKNGYLTFTTVKTGVLCELTVSAKLMTAIEACRGDMTFLKSESDQPFRSDKALSQRVAKWFRQAGIPTVTAHGVRKWLATRMAENGATEYELMAWFGWRDPKEARPYVTAANRRKLADKASARIANV